MKTKTTFLLITLLLGVHLNSRAHITVQRITPGNNYITEEIKIDGFDGIKSNIVGDIYYIQSDTFSIKIYGPDNIVPLIKTAKKGSTLHFSNEKF